MLIKNNGTAFGGFLIICLWLALVIGWVLNIVDIFNAVSTASSMADIPPIVILRVIGIFVAPMGSVLGYF